ncbi:hypothetical protein [Actinoalloteichus caeruleus]|uniref:Uncharacterized protein n=1 Tax=Actinoalloteichus caeruleus DSM 43889 TaxID=1120930 RepID=A0ABT1JM02_ACTCY|nr:hypothetical protein [Actinoalloteichus caeruleus]MCP2333179.1 hypothetical protein [Actinoalloteichus caeruleus DSM 43889]
MDEDEVRQRLRDVASDEPPMTFDLERMLQRGRERRRNRRAALASAGGVLSVSALLLASSTFLGGPDVISRLVPAAPASSVAAPEPAGVAERREILRHHDWRSMLPPDLMDEPPADWVPEDVEEGEPPTTKADEMAARAAEVIPYLEQRLAELAPELFVLSVDYIGNEGPGFVDGETHVNGDLGFEDEYGHGQVIFQHTFPGAAPGPSDHPCGPRSTCGYRMVGDGSLLEYSVTRLNEREAPPMLWSVTHFRTDGSTLMMTSYTYDISGRTPDERPLPAPGFDTLVALATDPGVDLRPRW